VRVRKPAPYAPAFLAVLGLLLISAAAAVLGLIVSTLLGIGLGLLVSGLSFLVLSWLAEPDETGRR
jgi:hypothetical protein